MAQPWDRRTAEEWYAKWLEARQTLLGISDALNCDEPCDMSEPGQCRTCLHKPYRRWCAGCTARIGLQRSE